MKKISKFDTLYQSVMNSCIKQNWSSSNYSVDTHVSDLPLQPAEPKSLSTDDMIDLTQFENANYFIISKKFIIERNKKQIELTIIFNGSAEQNIDEYNNQICYIEVNDWNNLQFYAYDLVNNIDYTQQLTKSEIDNIKSHISYAIDHIAQQPCQLYDPYKYIIPYVAKEPCNLQNIKKFLNDFQK